MVIRLSLILMGMVLLMQGGAVQAENLPDPTRPPGGVDATMPALVPSGPVLQVIRSFDGMRIAIISGQTVKVGASVNDAIVARIDEDRVLLRGPAGVQTLKLFPDVEKNPAASGQLESKPGAKMPIERAKRKEHK